MASAGDVPEQRSRTAWAILVAIVVTLLFHLFYGLLAVSLEWLSYRFEASGPGIIIDLLLLYTPALLSGFSAIVIACRIFKKANPSTVFYALSTALVMLAISETIRTFASGEHSLYAVFDCAAMIAGAKLASVSEHQTAAPVPVPQAQLGPYAKNAVEPERDILPLQNQNGRVKVSGRETIEDHQRGYITLGEIAGKLPMLRIRCDRCGREGRYRTDRLAAKYGEQSSIQPFQDDITRDCPNRNDTTSELGKGCAPVCPDLPTLIMGLHSGPT